MSLPSIVLKSNSVSPSGDFCDISIFTNFVSYVSQSLSTGKKKYVDPGANGSFWTPASPNNATFFVRTPTSVVPVLCTDVGPKRTNAAIPMIALRLIPLYTLFDTSVTLLI